MSAQIPILEHPDGFGITWIHPCALHAEEMEIDPIAEDGSNIPGCPECGCLIEWDACIWCGVAWLVYGGNAFDDTIRSASSNSYGDFMCARCAIQEEEGQEYSDEWEHDYP